MPPVQQIQPEEQRLLSQRPGSVALALLLMYPDSIQDLSSERGQKI